MKLSDYLQSTLFNANVELFQINADDLSPAHLQWLRDPHVGKFLEARFQEHNPETLQCFVRDCAVSPTVLLLGIKRTDTRQYVGNIKLRWDPNHGVGDIGIMIGDIPSWGKGLASSAISLMCKLGFGYVGLRKIIAGAYASNVGSIRSFERCGFKVEATLVDHVMQDGHTDSVCMMRLFECEYVELESSAQKSGDIDNEIRAKWVEALTFSLSTSGLAANFLTTASASWQQAWEALPFQPVACARHMLAYQHEYLFGAGWQVHDASLVLLHDDRPCGLWPLTLGRFKGKTTLTSANTPVMPPVLCNGLSPKSVKTICSRALQFLEDLSVSISAPMPLMQWPVFAAGAERGLSEWQQQLLRNGVIPSTRYELFVDLQPDMTEIRNVFRKSYRPLINKGLSLFANEVVDANSITPEIWSEFKCLHLEVAGRSTRTGQTWQQQYDMILTGSAFLVTVRDRDTARMVGAGFFQYTRDEGLYAVAAYDRNLFDKPIGHAVQHMAIEKMKSLGLKWYRIGERRYPQEMPPPTSKEVTIGEFKHGFASHEFVRYEYRWPIVSRQAMP